MNNNQELIDLLYDITYKAQQKNPEEDNMTELFDEGNGLLAQANEALAKNPNNTQLRLAKIELNFYLFQNTANVIEDAQIIIEMDGLPTTDTYLAYDWLTHVYFNVLNMPAKAKLLLIDQLLILPQVYLIKHECAEIASEILSRIASVDFEANENESAIQFLLSSFEKYPYNHQRNEKLIDELLKIEKFDAMGDVLRTYHHWHQNAHSPLYEAILQTLSRYFYEKKLDGTDLVSLFFMMRNEYDETKWKKDWNLYETEINAFYQDNYEFNIALAQVYDGKKNTEKSFEYRSKAASKPSNFFSVNVSKLQKQAQLLKKDFFNIPFTDELSANSLYNLLTLFYELSDNGNRKNYLEYALRFGKKSYEKYLNYFENGIGGSFNNQPHIFAMCCNNYALALRNKTFDSDNNSSDKDDSKLAALIHWKGYQYSPFEENIRAAIWDAQNAELYEDVVLYTTKYFQDFGNEISEYDYFQYKWYALDSYAKLKQYDLLTKTYLEVKEYYIDCYNIGNTEINKFIFCAQIVFTSLENEASYLDFCLAELDWFLNIEDFYYVNECEFILMCQIYASHLERAGQKELAVSFAQRSIEWFENNFDNINLFYKKRLVKAKTAYVRLTGNAITYPYKPYDLSYNFPNLTASEWTDKHFDLNDEAKNAQLALQIIEYYLPKGEKYFSFWYDLELTQYLFVEETDGFFNVGIIINDANDNMKRKYLFETFVSETKTGFLFNKKTEKRLDFTPFSYSNTEDNVEFNLLKKLNMYNGKPWEQEREQAQYWWNLICNRFCYLYNIKDI